MILNSGRHTQPDPQSCRVRSLGGEGGSPKTNNASRDQNKTEQCDANRDKRIHCQRKHRKSIPPAMSPDVMRCLQPASPTGLTPEKWKQTATLCPLDWPSNYSLLRLAHDKGPTPICGPIKKANEPPPYVL